jgi:threonine aldolase
VTGLHPRLEPWSGDPLALDFRSDAVTLPTAEMWEAMRSAEIGWATFGEDNNVLQLEEFAAALGGFEAAMYVESGSAGNLIAALSHTEPGQQVVLERDSHMVWCEDCNISGVAGLFPRLLGSDRGTISPDDLVAAILESRLGHRPATSLVVLENTHNLAGGAALSAEYTASVVKSLAGLHIPLHIDGARIFNASAALNSSLSALTSGAASVVVNLNKGLSAPAGAVLLGSASFIRKCRQKARQIAASRIHQAGILAATGLVALRTMMPQLAKDNARAGSFARLTATIPGIQLIPVSIRTNIVLIRISQESRSCPSEEYASELARYGVKALPTSAETIRFVFHRHITNEAVDYAIAAMIETSRTSSMC